MEEVQWRKWWINVAFVVCLFTCCATGAVHLELTRSMTIESYLLPLTRMMSRRGKIDVILSDNFKSNPKTLTKSSANAGTLSPAISHRKGSRVVLYSLEFHFPSYIPLGRILWKIKVKLVKTPLRKTLVKVMLNDRRRNEDNTYSSRGTNKQSSLDVAWISSDYFELLLLPQ